MNTPPRLLTSAALGSGAENKAHMPPALRAMIAEIEKEKLQ